MEWKPDANGFVLWRGENDSAGVHPDDVAGEGWSCDVWGERGDHLYHTEVHASGFRTAEEAKEWVERTLKYLEDD